MRETALSTGRNGSLVGIVTHPEPSPDGRPPPGALLLNSGFLHHVGPHCFYVRLARELADLGFLTLRLDFSGLGDSLARTDDVDPTESHLSETREVMDDLSARFGCSRFVLLGVCSGARESFEVAWRDDRVIGALLINPWDHLHDGRDEGLTSELRSRALRRHYLRLVFGSSFRRQVLRQAAKGDLNFALLLKALRGFLSRSSGMPAPSASHDAESPLQRMRALRARGTNVLHVYSEGDPSVDYFHVVLGSSVSEVPFEFVRGTNHTFTPLWSREPLSAVVLQWAKRVLEEHSQPSGTGYP